MTSREGRLDKHLEGYDNEANWFDIYLKTSLVASRAYTQRCLREQVRRVQDRENQRLDARMS